LLKNRLFNLFYLVVVKQIPFLVIYILAVGSVVAPDYSLVVVSNSVEVIDTLSIIFGREVRHVQTFNRKGHVHFLYVILLLLKYHDHDEWSSVDNLPLLSILQASTYLARVLVIVFKLFNLTLELQTLLKRGVLVLKAFLEKVLVLFLLDVDWQGHEVLNSSECMLTF
jgi:hypothetical protein